MVKEMTTFGVCIYMYVCIYVYFLCFDSDLSYILADHFGYLPFLWEMGGLAVFLGLFQHTRV